MKRSILSATKARTTVHLSSTSSRTRSFLRMGSTSSMSLITANYIILICIWLKCPTGLINKFVMDVIMLKPNLKKIIMTIVIFIASYVLFLIITIVGLFIQNCPDTMVEKQCTSPLSLFFSIPGATFTLIISYVIAVLIAKRNSRH